MIVYFQGRFIAEDQARVSIRDHGFLYGDGVYETIRVIGGKPFYLEDHLNRLEASLAGIHLAPPLSRQKISFAVRRTIELNKHKEAAVRLTITRGEGPYGLDPRLCGKPTVVVTSTPFEGYPARFYQRGMTLAVVSVRRNSPRSLPPSVKSTSCLNGVLAKIEATALGAEEGLMLTHGGKLAEGTVSNVFLVKNGTLLTPKLLGDLLPGVTRARVCVLARRSGLRVREASLPLSALVSADEVFLTNTLMDVMPVGRIVFGGSRRARRVPIGPVTRDLLNFYSVAKSTFEREK